MHVALQCRGCAHAFAVTDEPRALATLACPACGRAALPEAAEDFASALEDALVQLWHLRQSFHMQVHLDTEAIAAAFCPPPPSD